ncbi:response regulator, partial [Leptolyngbya sp. FACHB-321]|uniref:hybrid sensor histidine kinase/response regulator n=1 Tax=Leptolyngbya sp. FACHB-321 TaxID=2692807 RepID=UPI001683B3F7
DLELLLLDVLETLSVKELEVQTQGGHWYLLRIRPYRTLENQIDGVVLVLMDIDALKRSATTLEAARNYAEAIVETVQVPLVVLESDLRVNKANRSFYDTFQVAPLETAQTLIFELGNGQWNIPGLQALLEDVFSHDAVLQNFEVEHEFERIGQKTMLLNGWKIRQDGETQRLLLSLEDITERKYFETERSQLLSQEQAARQAAETASRAKDEFLSNLSHELRNPLNTMLGWAQILRQRQQDDATVERALDIIERSARAQSQLIEDMLDIARITSGKLHLSTHLLDLSTLINNAVESVQLAADAKAIQVVAQVNSATVVGDVDRLQQVLWNLLSNAIKFTPAGGRVDVTLATVQNHAAIRVTDTGQGIRAELLPYVFDRFRQGNSSTSKDKQGLGLGLSIARQLVELHGGTVQAESPGEGQGTTLTVRLPLRSLPVDITPPGALELTAIEPLAVEPQALPSLAGLTILVVDDEVDSLDLNRWTLEDAGATVVAVTAARDAIAALTASPKRYDVLLADIGMPDEDGLMLIRQVRALEAAAGGQIPAAAITAYVTERERQGAIEAGFQRHLAKPFDLAQLLWVVADLTGQARDASAKRQN